jgi:uncharacterized phiE125 gp8 family phage protein
MTTANGPGAVALGEEDRAAAIAAVKALLRVTSDDEDALIGDLAASALGIAEHMIGQVTIAREMTLDMAARHAWQRIAAAPVSAILAVSGRDAAGETIALTSGGYAIDIDGDGDGWIRAARPAALQGLSVTVSAGLAADWASLPAAIRQGVTLLAAHLYDNRDGAGAPPAAVTALWRPYRRMRLGERVPA